MAGESDNESLNLPKGDKRLLSVSLTTAEIAIGVVSNKYSNQLNLWGVLLIWAIPSTLFLVWLGRRERQRGMLMNLWKRHRVSYSIIAIVAVVTTSILLIKLHDLGSTSHVALSRSIVPVGETPSPMNSQSASRKPTLRAYSKKPKRASSAPDKSALPSVNPPLPSSQTLLPPQQADHGIINNESNYGTQTIEDNRLIVSAPPLQLSLRKLGNIDPKNSNFSGFSPNYIQKFSLESNSTLTPVAVAITFDAPVMEITEVNGSFNDPMNYPISPDEWYVYFRSPPLSPDGPVQLDVLSETPVKVISVEKSRIRR